MLEKQQKVVVTKSESKCINKKKGKMQADAEDSPDEKRLEGDEPKGQSFSTENMEVNESIIGTSDMEKNKPHRRYWTPKEEERFFEIWGRENWHLTRHGKNTLHFSRWAEEMHDRFNIDVKPEEIQAKVNQTRSKFRQVKKQIEQENFTTKWKKYDIIEKILRNEYRPKDAEPLPANVLENNRDYSPSELNTVRRQTPTSLTSNSTDELPAAQQQRIIPSGVVANEQQINVEPNTISVNLPNVGLLSSTDSGGGNIADEVITYNTELFSDDVQIKKEEPLDYNEYDESHLQEETPQQYLAQHQQEIYKQHTNNTLQSDGSQLNSENHIQEVQSNQLEKQNNDQSHALQQNNQNHTANTNQTTNNNSNTPCTNNNLIIAPRAASTPATAQARKRRAPSSYNHTGFNSTTSTQMVTKVNAPNDSLEAMYMEEVRKKNRILDEQKEIARKRLIVEERKLALLEQFFPKCLALQEQILEKLNRT